MSIYNEAFKEYPHKTDKSYLIYIRYNRRVDPEILAESLNRKIKDFGTDRYNTLSMSFIFKNRCKNFMLKLKQLVLRDEDVKEVSIREIK